jgi:hypothetical protein
MGQPTLAAPAPALAEIEEALVPALIVEKLEDGSYTVLVPSVPDADGRSDLHPAARTGASGRRAVYRRAQGVLEVGYRRRRIRPGHAGGKAIPGRVVGRLIDHSLFTAARRSSAKFVWAGRRCGIQLTRQPQAFFVRRNKLAQLSSVL